MVEQFMKGLAELPLRAQVRIVPARVVVPEVGASHVGSTSVDGCDLAVHAVVGSQTAGMGLEHMDPDAGSLKPRKQLLILEDMPQVICELPKPIHHQADLDAGRGAIGED